jgi:hypothetical protein
MHVPGWRHAVLLHDPVGVASAIKQEALAWQWGLVADRCDEWVAESLTGYAEEVHKLRTSLRDGEWITAAAQRSVLALRLASILAIHRRILYGSENRLWDLVGAEMGTAWREAQAAAFAVGRESVEASGQAAVRLFQIAVDEVRPLLDDRQRAVADDALRNAQL